MPPPSIIQYVGMNIPPSIIQYVGMNASSKYYSVCGNECLLQVLFSMWE